MAPSPASEYTVADQQRMSRAVNYFGWQSRISAKALGSRILEVGCGLGNFTAQILDRERIVGIDIDAECVRLHRERFAGQPNVRSLVMDAADNATDLSFLELRQEGIDSIACLNVLEHIEDDLLTLTRFREILPNGGRVVLIVPAFHALYGPIDRNLGHFRRYTKRSLSDLAGAAGLRTLSLRFMNSIGFFGWWVNAKLLRRQEQSEDQIAIFDSVLVPVMSRCEGWIEPPVGQSIFAVLEKA